MLLRIVWACLRKQPALLVPSAGMVVLWGAALTLTKIGLRQAGPLFGLWLFSAAYLLLVGALVGLATLIAMGTAAAVADDVINGRRPSVAAGLARALAATPRLAGYALLCLLRVRRIWSRVRTAAGTAISLIVLRGASPAVAFAEPDAAWSLDPWPGTGLLLVATLVTTVVLVVASSRLPSDASGSWWLLVPFAAVAALLGLESVMGACVVNLYDVGDAAAPAPRAPPALPSARASVVTVAAAAAAALLFAGAGLAFTAGVSAWAVPSPGGHCPAGRGLDARCVIDGLLFIAVRAIFPLIYVATAVGLASARVRARTLPDPRVLCAHLTARIARQAERLRALPALPLTLSERLRLAAAAVGRALPEFSLLHRPAVRRLLRRASRARLPAHALDDAATTGGTEAAARRLLDEAASKGESASWGAWVVPLLLLLIVQAACAVAYRAAVFSAPAI